MDIVDNIAIEGYFWLDRYISIHMNYSISSILIMQRRLFAIIIVLLNISIAARRQIVKIILLLGANILDLRENKIFN